MSEDAQELVTDIIAGILGRERASIKPTSRFQEDLEADSLEVLDLILTVEEQLGIEIPDETAETLPTVGDLVAYIAKVRPTSVWACVAISSADSADERRLALAMKSSRRLTSHRPAPE